MSVYSCGNEELVFGGASTVCFVYKPAIRQHHLYQVCYNHAYREVMYNPSNPCIANVCQPITNEVYVLY